MTESCPTNSTLRTSPTTPDCTGSSGCPRTSIVSREDGRLDFPVGAVPIITVGYLDDIRNPLSSRERIIETRLFVNRRSGWDGLQYVWNSDTTEAELSVARHTSRDCLDAL